MQTLLDIGLLLQVKGITPGRAAALVPGVLALISIIIGWLTLARARRTGSGRTGAIVALTIAVIAIVLSILHLASTRGAFGTGSGRAGAIVALVLGLTGTFISTRVLTRLQRIAKGNSMTVTGIPGKRT